MNERCGLVAVLGAPNAGKSTLVNALVGQKVAIVSPKAQTTRARLMGIAIEDKAQILLVDTLGIFEPRRRLDRARERGTLDDAQHARFLAEGAIGSHLEDLQRRDGYKGFNQQAVGAIVAAVDPRLH